MMKISINIWMGLILAVMFVGSCRKDNNRFKGTDNSLVSFHLEQAGTVLEATIFQDSVILTVPTSFSLSGAKATMELSENARIAPDPATITDWDTVQHFVVTSYNGTERDYTYSVQRNVLSSDGDILLATQADVAALGASGIGRINGSLIIGKSAGSDSIYSLAPLSGITSVASDLIINSTYAGRDLVGLENLKTTGSFQIGPDKASNQIGARMNLDTIYLPKLTAVMSDMIINGVEMKILNFPELTKIDGGLQLVYLDSLKEMAFPKVQSILQNVLIQGSSKSDNLQTINFPSLAGIGGTITITQWPQLATVKFPVLLKAVSMSIISFPSLTSVEAPLLQNVRGDANFSGNPQLKVLDLSALKTVGGNFYLQNAPVLDNLNGLKNLTTVGRNLSLYTLSSIKDINGLKALQSVGGDVNLSGFLQMNDDNLSGLFSLKSIGGALSISQVPFKKFSGLGLTDIKSLSIDGSGISTIQEIDISSLDIQNSLSLTNISSSFKLSGKDVYDCSVSLQNCNIDMAKNMRGFKEIEDFTYQYYTTDPTVSDEALPIQKVTNNFTLYLSAYSSFSLPDLEEVGGAFNVTINTKMNLVIPILKSSGKIVMTLTGSDMDVFSLPSLEMVHGDCTFNTGNLTSSVGDIEAPKLTTIDGILTVSGQYAGYENTRLTNLNGFSSLTSVKGVTISYIKELTDFSGLKNALPSFPAEKWFVTGNKYNPTYQDMLDGKYIQPE